MTNHQLSSQQHPKHPRRTLTVSIVSHGRRFLSTANKKWFHNKHHDIKQKGKMSSSSSQKTSSSSRSSSGDTKTSGQANPKLTSSAATSSNTSSLPSSFVATKAKNNASFASMKTPSSNQKTATTTALTLASLLRYMEGYEVIVELKTGKRHQGILTTADDDMNMTLKQSQNDDDDELRKRFVSSSVPVDADTHHQQQSAEPSSIPNSWTLLDDDILPSHGDKDNIITTIRGSQVRYIQFPDNANLSNIVWTGREREFQARNKYRKTLRKSK